MRLLLIGVKLGDNTETHLCSLGHSMGIWAAKNGHDVSGIYSRSYSETGRDFTCDSSYRAKDGS